MDNYITNNDKWRLFGRLLGLEIVIIDTFELGVDIACDKVALLKGFGAPKGMLLFPNEVNVLRYHDVLVQQGYGYSVLNGPSSNFLEELKSYTEMLAEWDNSKN